MDPFEEQINRHSLSIVLALIALIFGASSSVHAQARPQCNPPQAIVRGRVAGLESARGRLIVAIQTADLCHGVVPDSSGSFALRTAPGPQIITAKTPDRCVTPMVVTASPGRVVNVTLTSVEVKNPMDDAMIMVQGTPYVPPTYAERQCRAHEKFVETNPGVRDLREAPLLPTPDSVLAIVLRSGQLVGLLGDTRPLRFRYWNEPAATRKGSIDGVDYEVGGDTRAYIVVHYLTPTQLDVQIGRTDGAALRAQIDLRTGSFAIVERWLQG